MKVTRTSRIWPLALCLALWSAAPATTALAADDAPMDAGRAARWKAIAAQIFGDRKIEPTETLIRLDVPKRAEDASLVPVTLTMPEKDKIKSVYLVIDDNPSPLAAHVAFGPAADPGSLQLRVRIDTYTNVHAVAETRDGRLYETVAFVKASGGCSAPAGASDEEALAGMGEMRMKFARDAVPGKPVAATLMVRHPNFNGMQMNQVTRHYTAPRYIDKLSVSYGNSKVFDLETDISLSTNPVITFSFVPDGKGQLEAVASDTVNGRWRQTFEAPAATN
jgi:sulfur-oxidizing protein SoxY